MAFVIGDHERCYRAVQARDPRFDGWFFTGVTSTGIYCRPSCPARTPDRRNVRFFPSAAAAQQAGLRACLRCRPDATPGSPEWNGRADVVARAMRLIADGVVDREGVGGLATRLGYGARHLHRLLVAEVGAGPIALARAQRVQTARLLLETTGLAMAEVAFGAGFASVRQFNDTVREVLGRAPGELRRRSGAARGAVGGFAASVRPHSGPPGAIVLRLPYRRPMPAAELLDFLAARAVPGVEARQADGSFARSLRLPSGHGWVALSDAGDHIAARLVLADLRDLTTAVGRCRRLLDLDADPAAVDATLSEDPLLRPLVAATPGRRVPGTVDGFELAVRAIVGQQVSVPGARTVTGLLAATGPPLAVAPAVAAGARTERLFPSPEELLDAPDTAFAMPAARRNALRHLAAAVADGSLVVDPGADPGEVSARLGALPGVGPWTVAYVRMRALRDPDAFPSTDLGVRRRLERLGERGDLPGVLHAAERWRPWRAYATAHLWSPSPAGTEARIGVAGDRRRRGNDEEAA